MNARSDRFVIDKKTQRNNAKQHLNILGICRFSMLGRGDWKAYRNQPDENLEEIYEQKAKELFSPARLEDRLRTFEHLTLRSINAQTEKDFKFLVASSDKIPKEYRERLELLCQSSPNIILKFVPPMHIVDLTGQVIEELSWTYSNTLQFRLDDDDCISAKSLRQARMYASTFPENQNFVITFAQQYYCISDGPTAGVYNWFNPFLGAALMLRHQNCSVYQFPHYRIQRKFVSLIDPAFPNIITHRGVGNDTPRHSAHILRKAGMVPATHNEIRRALKDHFHFLQTDGLKLCGFDKFLDDT